MRRILLLTACPALGFGSVCTNLAEGIRKKILSVSLGANPDFLPHGLTHSVSPSFRFTSLFLTLPTSLPPFPPLFPPLAVAFCQSAHPPGWEGAFDPSSFKSPLSAASTLFSPAFPLQPSALMTLQSCTSGLHCLPSSLSSKMTYSFFAPACQIWISAAEKSKRITVHDEWHHQEDFMSVVITQTRVFTSFGHIAH